MVKHRYYKDPENDNDADKDDYSQALYGKNYNELNRMGKMVVRQKMR